jgi:hypothetical protein
MSYVVTIEIIFENDLPNGPYGEMTMNLGGGGGGKIYVPPSSYYKDVETAILDAWKKNRGSALDMRVGIGRPTEEWKVVKIEYKGGAVSPTDISTEGPHNVTLNLKLICCVCAVM